MDQTKYLKGECSHCGGHLEFPAESTGMTADCPHCSQQTELLLARPKEEPPAIPLRSIILALIALIILGGGLAGSLYAIHLLKQKAGAASRAVSNQTQTNAGIPAPEPDVASRAGFHASLTTIEKSPGSSLVYASGSLTNAEKRQRFGVKVQLDLFDASGKKVGQASDYQSVVETNGVWRFQALVVDARKTASAKISSVDEQK